LETHGVEFNVTPLYFGSSPYIMGVSNLGRETWLFGVEFLSLPSLVWKEIEFHMRIPCSAILQPLSEQNLR